MIYKMLLLGKHVPTEEVHPDVFKGANKVFSRPKAHLLARERHNKVVSAAKQKAITKRLQDKTKQRLSKIAKLGVNYSLPGHCTETSVRIVDFLHENYEYQMTCLFWCKFTVCKCLDT